MKRENKTVHYYNKMFDKKKLRKQSCEIDGEEENTSSRYVTAINIFSKTRSKSHCLKVDCYPNKPRQAFAEAASKTSDVFKKDQAPFVIQNFLGPPISVSPSDSFTALNVDSHSKSIELGDGESLAWIMSVPKPS
ncbi:unnamed protein product [Ranitomeya imitator]|uniref:Cycloidea-like protein n=1 Tax=Ranitomeya imitator TaxID=111125 RepID=A0ABN9M3A4_9NEOB|nr:unnamed protein product [Ranitomeya imitator]